MDNRSIVSSKPYYKYTIFLPIFPSSTKTSRLWYNNLINLLMSELPRFTIPMPQEDAASFQLEASVIPPAEAAQVRSLAILTSQTINSMYGKFIPRDTIEANHDISIRVIVP